MSDRFDYFIVFAEMRTGSNFLETNLNAFEDISCHGEAFNPHFIGYPNRTEILGVTQAMREADPARLISEVRAAPGMNGFRFFHDHDARVLEIALADPRCAKIVLTRNPAESYVSWKIAQATGQWKLTNVKKRKEGLAEFDVNEFSEHLERMQSFQVTLLNALQITGQTAFYVAYEDLQDIAVMNGIAQWLGTKTRLDSLDKSLKVQNPEPISEKVANFEEMEKALTGLDRFNLTRTPNFEPRRGAAVPSYIAGAQTPLLFLPVKGGPEKAVARWLATLDGVNPGELPGKFNQGSLRQWQKAHPGHRSFAVLRHPVARAHSVFCARFLTADKGSFSEIRQTLRRIYKLPIPNDGPDHSWDRAKHKQAFLAFLTFLKANLAGQAGIRVDAHWATQAQILQGFSEFAPADVIVREEELEIWLPALAMQLGHTSPPPLNAAAQDMPIQLEEIYDEEIEAAAQAAYARDYATFGFGSWR